jgi:hypothetical protein
MQLYTLQLQAYATLTGGEAHPGRHTPYSATADVAFRVDLLKMAVTINTDVPPASIVASRWCECSCDVYFVSLPCAPTNLTITIHLHTLHQ